MNNEQLQKMQSGKGFIAALDQSGGSTPKALAAYGVGEDEYDNEEAMYDRVHQMRSRIMTAESFSGEHILGSILFKATMERQVEGLDTADYLWQQKQIVPFLKIDNGLEEESGGVQLMKPMPELEELLDRANEKNIFGTKMRSVIHSYSESGVKAVVVQQFEVALRILAKQLVPIVEPEVDIHSPNKAECEAALLDELIAHLDDLADDQKVMLKLTLPEGDNLYQALTEHPNVVRVVALSGGYSREEANDRLSRNNGMIASFSRALAQDLRANQSDDEFNENLSSAISSIYEASIT